MGSRFLIDNEGISRTDEASLRSALDGGRSTHSCACKYDSTIRAVPTLVASHVIVPCAFLTVIVVYSAYKELQHVAMDDDEDEDRRSMVGTEMAASLTNADDDNVVDSVPVNQEQPDIDEFTRYALLCAELRPGFDMT